MNWTLLDSYANTAGGPYTSNPVTPLPNRLVVIGIAATVASGQVTPAELDISGCGITWNTIRTGPPARQSGYLVRGMSANPTSGPISISGVGLTFTGIVYAIAMSDDTVDVSGGTAASTIRQSFMQDPPSTTTISEAFQANGAPDGDGLVPLTTNGAIAFISNGTALTNTPGAGWTELFQGSHSAPQNSGILMFATSAQTVTATQSVSSGPIVLAAEIKKAGGGGPPPNLDRLKLGASNVGLRVGSSTPSKVYMGSTQVWP